MAHAIKDMLLDAPHWQTALAHALKCPISAPPVADSTLNLAKFLILRANDANLHPTQEIDQAWHILMLNPALNQNICRAFFGLDFLPHAYQPPIEDPEQSRQAMQQLADVWARNFEETMPAAATTTAVAPPRPVSATAGAAEPAEQMQKIRILGPRLDVPALVFEVSRTKTIGHIVKRIRERVPSSQYLIITHGQRLEDNDLTTLANTFRYVNWPEVLTVHLSPQMRGC
jgi:hypothetical protein